VANERKQQQLQDSNRALRPDLQKDHVSENQVQKERASSIQKKPEIEKRRKKHIAWASAPKNGNRT
jgi:hypothetical protein